MKNEYLNQIASQRELVFDDIVYVLKRACKAKVHHAVEKSDWSAESIAENLNSAGCTNIEIFRVGTGESDLTCNCVVHLVEEEVDGIKAPYSQMVCFDVCSEETSRIGYGVGLIGLLDEMCDIDELYHEYMVDPVSFDINLFCI